MCDVYIMTRVGFGFVRFGVYFEGLMMKVDKGFGSLLAGPLGPFPLIPVDSPLPLAMCATPGERERRFDMRETLFHTYLLYLLVSFFLSCSNPILFIIRREYASGLEYT